MKEMNRGSKLMNLLSMKFFIVAVLFLFSAKTFAGKGTEIKITVKDLGNTQLVLANYYGDKQYIKDTFMLDKTGVCNIKMDTVLPPGIYLAVFPKLNNKYFEFVVSEPKIVLATDSFDLAGHMKVEGSAENKVFYDDMFFLSEKRKELERQNALLREAKDEKAKSEAKANLQKIDDEVKAKRLSVEKDHPTALYSKLLRSMREPELSKDGPRNAKGVLLDSAWQWREYKAKYWDNVDLSDDRLIRTPIFHNKLSYYYTKVIIQNPDTLIRDGDELLSRMNPKNDLFRYSLVYMLNEMAKSKIMGFDAVYTHIVNKYYAKGYTPWVDSTQLYKIVERGRILEPLLIGKKARNIVLADSTLKQMRSLYEVKSRYTILAFWDPDCGHCKKEIPKLVELYHKMKAEKIDIEVFSPGIFDIAEMKKWTDFIKENKLDWINVADPYHQNNFRFEWDIQSTPQLFILDKDKVIKAKRIGVENIEDFVKHDIDPKYIPKNTAPLEEKKEVEEH
jgi:thiol-disulfide isomerase/thioredoxin